MNTAQPLWTPSPARINDALISRFMGYVAQRYDREFGGYESLYEWSLDEKESFWSALWDFGEVVGDKGRTVLLHGENIEKALWFPEANLNFAENLLRTAGDTVAIYFRAEDKVAYQLTWNQLRNQVASVAAWLRSVGVKPGDRVAGYLPNMPEAVVAMLGTASLGAVWTSTSPDFGKESVIERFGQAEPKVLFASDGYYYNGKTHDIRQKVEAIAGELTSLEQVVTVRLADLEGDCPGADWAELLAIGADGQIDYQRMGFNDPLYILYSSGTTGKPKCITHKAGGVLLQHLKELKLHSDVRPGDRIFYFTTCGWMMWNWLVSGLACGASLVLYDGSPFYPGGNVLWDYAEEVGVTLFGTSAKYIDSLKKAGLAPGKTHNLSSLRTLCSTGSVLIPESFDYVYDSINSDLCLSSISGGTDIVSCFVLGCPILPVYRGEIQCRGLGMAVEVFDAQGRSIVDQKGELVCTSTFPSQPVYFWGDATGEKYHNAYFSRYRNVWHHGDYIKLCRHGGVVIYGRSDTTLNPGGVRIGTAEIYRYVEQLDAVLESIAVGQEYEGDLRVVLFVVLRPGLKLDDALKAEIRKTLRENCSPRHVPAEIIQVTEIPRTKSGKIVELAVREIIHDRPVTNISALANPKSLELFKNLPELQ
ncbi:MAG: acetoacetate--CoA ligase [Desulforhopalus sp.]